MNTLSITILMLLIIFGELVTGEHLQQSDNSTSSSEKAVNAKPTAKPTTKQTTKPSFRVTLLPTAKSTSLPKIKPTAKPSFRVTLLPTPKPTAKSTWSPITGSLIDFQSIGGILNSNLLSDAIFNQNLLNKTLNSLLPGDKFVIPSGVFNLLGGIAVYNINGVTIQIDGTLSFTPNLGVWPTSIIDTPVYNVGQRLHCIYMQDIYDITFTSSTQGLLDGNGRPWWGESDRPKLMVLKDTRNIIVEKLYFKNSPFWHFFGWNANGMIIRNCRVDARWDTSNSHTNTNLINAPNTDGFDVSGTNVHIHDCVVWCQDDCVSIKGPASNMLIERMQASGLGLVVGAVGLQVVNNITFRDSYMDRTYKGIYLKTLYKTDPPNINLGAVTNIVYSNITMNKPDQYAIWIGPAQQIGQKCSLAWPQLPGSTCIPSPSQIYENITLKNIYVIDAVQNPGVLLADQKNPMRNILFDNVKFTNPQKTPFQNFYKCSGITNGKAIHGSYPVPGCFTSV
eukprot:gene13331-17873_t